MNEDPICGVVNALNHLTWPGVLCVGILTIGAVAVALVQRPEMRRG